MASQMLIAEETEVVLVVKAEVEVSSEVAVAVETVAEEITEEVEDAVKAEVSYVMYGISAEY